MNSEKFDYIENIRQKLFNNEKLTYAEIHTIISALHESKECFQEPYYELVYHDKYDRVERRIMNPTRTLTYRTDDLRVKIAEDHFDLTFRRIVHEEDTNNA